MPVYAPTSGFADQHRNPRALLLIVGGHALLIAAVMTARMDAVRPFVPTTTEIELIPAPKPPPENPPPPDPKQRSEPRESYVDRPPTIMEVPDPIDDFDFTPSPLPSDPGPTIGSGNPTPRANRAPDPVRVGPRFATPDWALKPPYPDDKRRLEEEGVLRLRLSIDERGRVVSVEPVGSADRSFIESARRHLIAHWRYKPATEDGRPVPSSTVITLRFELEG